MVHDDLANYNKIQLGIKGVELEEIAMGFAGRRTGPAITDFPKVIAALARTVSRLLVLRKILREGAQTTLHAAGSTISVA